MNLRNKRRELHGAVGGLGVAVAVLGLIGGLYEPRLAIAGAFVIWIVGATLVNIFTDKT